MPYLEILELVSDNDYDTFVEMVSLILVKSNGDAGKIFRDAYHHVQLERNAKLRSRKLAFIESVRHAYISAD